jgi:hypothetical protein
VVLPDRVATEEDVRLSPQGHDRPSPARADRFQLVAITPSEEAIEHAQRVVRAFSASQREGKGAFALDGKMIDMPLLKNAQKVLDRAKAAGKIQE